MMLRDDYQVVGRLARRRQNAAYPPHSDDIAFTLSLLPPAIVRRLTSGEALCAIGGHGIGHTTNERFDVRSRVTSQWDSNVFPGASECRQRTATDVVALEMLQIA